MQSIDYDGVAALYDAYVTADLEIPFFTAKGRRAGGPVLELTAGMGRLSVPFADAGADLTCIDHSRGMLVVLARKLADRGLAAEVRCVNVCHLRDRRRGCPGHPALPVVHGVRRRGATAGRAGRRLRLPTARRTVHLHLAQAVRPPAASRRGPAGSSAPSRSRAGAWWCPASSRAVGPSSRGLQFFEFFGPEGRLAWKRLLPMPFKLVEREPSRRWP